jgi:hypothetical protein
MTAHNKKEMKEMLSSNRSVFFSFFNKGKPGSLHPDNLETLEFIFFL